MSKPTESFALAVRSPSGEHWQYIGQAASFGNAMKTTSPFHARTWPTIAEAELWAEDRRREVADVERKFAERGDRLQSRVVETEYAVIPLAIRAGEPSGTITLSSLEARESRRGVPGTGPV